MTRRYLVVGAGFTGATVAERLAAHGHGVVVVDRRPHLGGNAHDRLDEHGVRIGPYGPHLFHTRSAAVWGYVNRFARFNGYELRVQAAHGDRFYDLPLNLQAFSAFWSTTFTEESLRAHLARVREPIARPRNAEEAIVGQVGREIYEAFYAGYTRKQWGVDPRELDPSVTLRLPIRTSSDSRYFHDPFQGVPSEGFTALFERMLAHPAIAVHLGVDFRDVREAEPWERVVYTGPIDAYFGYALGRLPYRSIDFRFASQRSDGLVQPAGILTYPNEHAYTRSSEYRHFYRQDAAWTTLSRDYPCWNDDAPYYPVPSPVSRALYRRYRALAAREPGTVFGGRLGTYRYFNMDQCIAQALVLARRLLGERGG
jgi:UDP-galactopyranose mutase